MRASRTPPPCCSDGRVLIAGGRGDAVTATAELYDPKTKQFVPTGSMQVARYKHTAGLLPMVVS